MRQEDLDDRPVWVHSKMISKKENEILPSFPSEKETHSSNSQYWLASCCFFLTLFSSFCMHWHVPYPFSSSCPSAGGSVDIIHLLCRSKLWGNPTFIDARTVHCAFSLSFYSYQIPKHILKVIFLSNVISTFLFNSLLFNILFLLLGILWQQPLHFHFIKEIDSLIIKPFFVYSFGMVGILALTEKFFCNTLHIPK